MGKLMIDDWWLICEWGWELFVNVCFECRYVVGLVVRIKCINFMIYDYVEFRLGFYFNMIFGFNGIGKSFIVVVIVIGFVFFFKVSLYCIFDFLYEFLLIVMIGYGLS